MPWPLIVQLRAADAGPEPPARVRSHAAAPERDGRCRAQWPHAIGDEQCPRPVKALLRRSTVRQYAQWNAADATGVGTREAATGGAEPRTCHDRKPQELRSREIAADLPLLHVRRRRDGVPAQP